MAAFHWDFGNCFADPSDEPDDYPTRHAVDVDAEGSAREWSEDAGASHNYEYIFCCNHESQHSPKGKKRAPHHPVAHARRRSSGPKGKRTSGGHAAGGPAKAAHGGAAKAASPRRPSDPAKPELEAARERRPIVSIPELPSGVEWCPELLELMPLGGRDDEADFNKRLKYFELDDLEKASTLDGSNVLLYALSLRDPLSIALILSYASEGDVRQRMLTERNVNGESPLSCVQRLPKGEPVRVCLEEAAATYDFPRAEYADAVVAAKPKRKSRLSSLGASLSRHRPSFGRKKA